MSILAPLLGEELHGFGKVLVGRAVHGGFAVLVHGVDVGAVVERHLHGFDHFLFGPCVFTGRPRAETSRRHQRRAALVVGQLADRRQGRPAPSCSRRRPSSRRADTPWRQSRGNACSSGSPACVIRALTSAPLATSRLANSRVDIVPEISGPGSLSPIAGFADVREHVERRKAHARRNSDPRPPRAALQRARDVRWRPPRAAASCRRATGAHLPAVSDWPSP